jgi:hypothetical protein
MFCPKCAAPNADNASFCRACGANVSLVPQALSGQLSQPVPNESRKESKRRHRSELRIEHTFKLFSMGLAFLCVAIALGLSRAGTGWWFYMFIPAFLMMGSGIGHYIRIKEQDKRTLQAGGFNQALHASQPSAEFHRRQTGELLSPPASVTEGTTRHLGTEAATRHFDASNEAPK